MSLGIYHANFIIELKRKIAAALQGTKVYKESNWYKTIYEHCTIGIPPKGRAGSVVVTVPLIEERIDTE